MFHHSNSLFSPKHEHRLLGLMLITLHLALWWDFSTLPFGFLLLRVVLLIHFGLFVLWQPLLNRLHTHRFRNLVCYLASFFLFLSFFPIFG